MKTQYYILDRDINKDLDFRELFAPAPLIVTQVNFHYRLHSAVVFRRVALRTVRWGENVENEIFFQKLCKLFGGELNAVIGNQFAGQSNFENMRSLIAFFNPTAVASLIGMHSYHLMNLS